MSTPRAWVSTDHLCHVWWVHYKTRGRCTVSLLKLISCKLSTYKKPSRHRFLCNKIIETSVQSLGHNEHQIVFANDPVPLYFFPHCKPRILQSLYMKMFLFQVQADCIGDKESHVRYGGQKHQAGNFWVHQLSPSVHQHWVKVQILRIVELTPIQGLWWRSKVKIKCYAQTWQNISIVHRKLTCKTAVKFSLDKTVIWSSILNKRVVVTLKFL